MAGDNISEEGRRERFARWEQLGVDQVKHDLLNGGQRVVGGPPAVRELAWKWVRMKEAETAAVSEERALIEKASALGAPIDDLLTADGKRLAWKALRGFKVSINDVLMEFHKDDVIREWSQIVELQKGKCPTASLKTELWRRVMAAQTTTTSLLDSEHNVMARRPTTQAAPPAPRKQLTVAEMRRGIERLRERVSTLKAFDLSTMTVEEPPEIAGMQVDLKGTLERIFGHDTSEYRRFESACDLQWQATVIYEGYPTLKDYQEGVREKIAHSLAVLAQAIRFLEEEIADAEGNVEESEPAAAARDLSKVFIVHGHDEGTRETVARFIQKLGFEPVILHEKPNKGRTIITKFREEAAGVGFAVVLMTPDDEGRTTGTVELKLRARQNVVFELGFFIGALRAERVAALVKGAIERPSDFDGVVYISLDDGTWQKQLGRELKEAGYLIDWNRVMG